MEEKQLYSKDGVPDRLMTQTQFENLGEGNDGWKRKRTPVKPAELDTDSQVQMPQTNPAVPSIKDQVASDTSQNKPTDGNSDQRAENAEGNHSDDNVTDPKASQSDPGQRKGVHEKVTEPKKNG